MQTEAECGIIIRTGKWKENSLRFQAIFFWFRHFWVPPWGWLWYETNRAHTVGQTFLSLSVSLFFLCLFPYPSLSLCLVSLSFPELTLFLLCLSVDRHLSLSPPPSLSLFVLFVVFSLSLCLSLLRRSLSYFHSEISICLSLLFPLLLWCQPNSIPFVFTADSFEMCR